MNETRRVPDFGDDDFDAGAGTADPTDPAFERYLSTLLGTLEPVPPAPREQMWARIDAARRGRRNTNGWRAGGRRGFALGVGLAAALALGVGIGRATALFGPGAAAPASVAAEPDGNLPYRIAAVQHLNRTQALLASLPTSAAGNGTDEVAAWAGDLLSQTRLLLDSPAGGDPELGHLLQDLELLLAQVAALSGARGVEDLDLIHDGIDQKDVMLRLRTATTVRPFAGT